MLLRVIQGVCCVCPAVCVRSSSGCSRWRLGSERREIRRRWESIISPLLISYHHSRDSGHRYTTWKHTHLTHGVTARLGTSLVCLCSVSLSGSSPTSMGRFYWTGWTDTLADIWPIILDGVNTCLFICLFIYKAKCNPVFQVWLGIWVWNKLLNKTLNTLGGSFGHICIC